MRKLSNENIIVVDVDETLILNKSEIKYLNSIPIMNPYDNRVYYYTPHTEHISLIRMWKGRGMCVIVWSGNGVEHAASVVKALGLDGYVFMCMTKPTRCVDDRTELEYICGTRIYIPFRSEK